MTATIRIPVVVSLDADLDVPKGYIHVKSEDDYIITAGVGGRAAMDELEAALARLLAVPKVGLSVDVGFVQVSRKRGKDMTTLTLYADSFSDPVKVRLDEDDLRSLYSIIRECWHPHEGGFPTPKPEWVRLYDGEESE